MFMKVYVEVNPNIQTQVVTCTIAELNKFFSFKKEPTSLYCVQEIVGLEIEGMNEAVAIYNIFQGSIPFMKRGQGGRLSSRQFWGKGFAETIIGNLKLSLNFDQEDQPTPRIQNL